MKERLKPAIWLILLISVVTAYGQTDNIILLNGAWRFQTDSYDVGMKERWMNRELTETVRLPGSMAENEKGEAPSLTTPWMGSIWDSSWYFNPAMAKYRKPGNVKFPFWLTPERYYLGAAWYQKEVMVPKGWDGQHIELMLERPHWQTTVWVDSALAGSQNSLSTPHRYDLSELMPPGRHRITICVDNSSDKVDPGNNSHSITDHTQGNWNGIVGQLYLKAKPQVWTNDVRIYPDITNKAVKVVYSLRKIGGRQSGSIKITLLSLPALKRLPVKKTTGAPVAPLSTATPMANLTQAFSIASDTSLEFNFTLGNRALFWNEFSPNLYIMKTELSARLGGKETCDVMFGMRDFKAVDTHFEVNGRPTFLRGTVECCVFPKTGYPPVDEDSWMRIFTICRNYGLNHMRFHSYCPPEAAFVAADKTGFYLQVEAPSWPNYSTALGIGRPIDQYIIDETQRIVQEYGNHPSFCMLATSNEPDPSVDYTAYLDSFTSYWRRNDSRRVYTGASVGRSWKLNTRNDYVVRAGARGLSWKSELPNTTFDYNDKLEDLKIPYVTHEMGQWCVFPNFGESKKYTGVYSAGNLDIFRDILAEHHMATQATDFLMASGKLQTLCYKMEIEAALRTTGLAGFQLLGLTDFPGQGTALVGTLDAFWDEKGYATSAQFKHFCNSTVPLARIPKFVYQNNEAFKADIEVAHFDEKPLEKVTPRWRIRNEKGIVTDSGRLTTLTIPAGNRTILGSVSVPLFSVSTARMLHFEVSVGAFINGWDFWVYPSVNSKPDTAGIYICNRPDEKAAEVLKFS